MANSQRLAVVTLAIGPKVARLAKLTHHLMEGYAEKVGADFVVIDKEQIRGPSIHWEKFQLRELFDRYARIAFLDTDLLVMPWCPNLFDIVPPGDFGATLVSKNHTRHDIQVSSIQQALGVVPGWVRDYFNTGVMVASCQHRDVFSMSHGAYVDVDFEQTQINFNVRKLGIPVTDLTYLLNHTASAGPDANANKIISGILHYAAKGHCRPGLDLVAQAQDDLTVMLLWNRTPGFAEMLERAILLDRQTLLSRPPPVA